MYSIAEGRLEDPEVFCLLLGEVDGQDLGLGVVVAAPSVDASAAAEFALGQVEPLLPGLVPELLGKVLVVELKKLVLMGIEVGIGQVEAEGDGDGVEYINLVGLTVIAQVLEQILLVGELLMEL